VGHRLQRPAVAVGVLEEDKASSGEDLDVADLHAALGEFLAGRVGATFST
jgi:hypothetical protein